MSEPTPPSVPGDSPSFATPVPQALPGPPNTLFRGPNGIRAGWRVLIFVCLVVAIGLLIAVLLGVVVGLIYGREQGKARLSVSTITPLGLGLTEACIFIVTALAALIMSRIEHRNFSAYGLPPRLAFQKNFWIGGVVGFLAISGSLLGIFALHGFRLEGLATHGSTILSSITAWGVTFILVGLAEEFAFRGYLQYTLTTGIGFWPSAILLSLLFGLAHRGNPGETYFGLVSVVLFGLLFCLFLRRTGNLWWAVGFHAGWDWGQTFFYGVPDSGIAPYHSLLHSSFSGPQWLTGGTVGPEASVFTPVALAIVALVFSRIYRENRYETRTVDLGPQTSAPDSSAVL
jgi:membrane protease YdiL (CAAX protease family)